VLWETLTGRRLFVGEGVGVVERIMAGKVEPPSAFRRSVSSELDALVLKGLARDPLARFASAREMALALERIVGIVPSSEVAEWALTLRRRELEERAKLVARIEESTSPQSDEFQVALLSNTVRDSASSPGPETEPPQTPVPLPAGKGGRPEEPSTIVATCALPARGARRSAYAFVGGGLALVGLLALAAVRIWGTGEGRSPFGLVWSPRAQPIPTESPDEPVPTREGDAPSDAGSASAHHRGRNERGHASRGTLGIIRAPDRWDPAPSASAAPPSGVVLPLRPSAPPAGASASSQAGARSDPAGF
jgi:serine/threonine-protein kinase